MSPQQHLIDPAAFAAAAFDLDGVITQTARVHAAAWKLVFDVLLQSRAARAGTAFRPFDSTADYLAHIDGKPRLDGVRGFLATRGITLPEGDASDGPDAETVHGIGNAKNARFHALLARDGVAVFASSVALVRALREAGRKVAIVSASRNAASVLAAAGLETLFDVRVDGEDAARLGLRGKPAPDIFLHAARLLGTSPERMLAIEDSLAGVAALRDGGFGLVIGVDRGEQAAALARQGADIVVPDLDEISLRAPPAPAALPGTDPGWLVVADGLDPAQEPQWESAFALSNGRLGTRGALAEGGAASAPATYVAGLFDTEPGAPPGLMALPDWSGLTIHVDGVPLRPDAGTLLAHRRTLDCRQGILWRDWRQQDAAGRGWQMRELRLASATDRNLLVQSVTVTAENSDATITVHCAVPKTWTGQSANGDSVALELSLFLTDLSHPDAPSQPLTSGQALPIRAGATYRIDRIAAVATSRDAADPANAARSRLRCALASGAGHLIAAHVRAWAELWQGRDIAIGGDAPAQHALRFAIYHLLSAANPDDDRVSIGARALTGSAYRGHVFWDTEIFMLPFFVLTWPRAARALLTYRHRTLPAARRRAAGLGYRGALYAWESADTGDDVTPAQAIKPDGTVVRILTGEQEHHISADVAFGVWRYWQATGDSEFLCAAGAEIILETARFWASRGRYEEDGRYHIRNVIGPDEYHESVDDNAYTNGMAGWSLRTAVRITHLMADTWPARWRELAAAIGLTDAEIATWSGIARDMVTGFDAETGLIAQFQGYFALEDIDLSAYAARAAPMDVVLGRERIARSQVVKQPDVIMLLCLLWDEFPRPVIEANFRYYEKRCGHGSSLSPAIHALAAARLGDTAMALRYFRQAIGIDIGNSMGNAAGGVHAAALGGLWQAAAFGFAGLRITDETLECQPNLPEAWDGLSLDVRWRGEERAIRVAR